MKQRKKICFVVTAESAVTSFLLEHLRALSEGYEITVAVNTKNDQFLTQQSIFAVLKPLSIARNIHLLADLKCLFQLIYFFKQQKFNAVHSVTPKAGLLAMLAAWLACVPLRTHTFTGQVWANKTGLKRFLLKLFDVLIGKLSTDNIVDSPSQRQFLLDEGVLKAGKSVVFADGSIAGVDLNRFKPNQLAKQQIRQQLGIAPNDLVFLFLGRLNQDKGVLDLARAFNDVGDAHLLFVGPDEQNMQQQIRDLTGLKNQFLHFVGHTPLPEDYMAAADVLCLPSYREGFGSVVIEAAAVGIPAVASRIYGITDAVVENETGLLHSPSDVLGIKNCMQLMLQNNKLRLQLGSQAKARANSHFNSKILTQYWVDFYRDRLG